MRLLFVSHSAELMGAERSLLTIVREAAGVRGHDVVVTVPGPGPLIPALTDAGARVRVLPTHLWMGRRFNPAVGSVRSMQALSSVPRYRAFIAETAPDVVVTNSAVVPAGAFAARGLGIPHVWTVRESLLTNPSLRSALPRRSIARIIGERSERVVAISRFVADQLTSAAPGVAEKITIIPPSIAPPAAPSGARAAGPPARLVLLGHFAAEKGQADAIAALGGCARAGHKLALRLAGVGADGRTHAESLAAEHGVSDLVEILEWTDDTAALYAWADATLMLSRNEAFGRVTVESLMHEVPVIGYRAGATTEILAEGGGLLVEPGVEQLTAALVELAAHRDGYERLRDEAAVRGQALRTAKPSAATFADFLEQLRRPPS